MKSQKKFKILKRVVKSSKPVIVEVGAHYGEDTMRFRKCFPKASIHAFEADPRYAQAIRELIGKKAKLVEAAVSDKDTDAATLYQPLGGRRYWKKYHPRFKWIPKEMFLRLGLGNSGASSLKRGHPLVETGKTSSVRTMRLDTWMEDLEISAIEVLWIDVQGAEREVITGVGERLKNVRIILVEYGAVEYHGAMTREETIDLVSEQFDCIEKWSDQRPEGDLFLLNKSSSD